MEGTSSKSSSNAEYSPARRRQQQLHQVNKTLGTGILRQAVQLPPGISRLEWLALHTRDFVDTASLLVSIVTDEKAPRLEPGCGFPLGYEYLWIDPRTKRALRCSGPEYIEHVLAWAATVLNDARLFPQPGSAPENYKGFEKTAKTIFKRLFRVFAILYMHYYQRMDAMGAVAHLNTSFKHYMYFVFEYELVQQAELEAIDALVSRLREEYQAQAGSQKQHCHAVNGSAEPASAATATDGSSGCSMAPLP